MPCCEHRKSFVDTTSPPEPNDPGFPKIRSSGRLIFDPDFGVYDPVFPTIHLDKDGIPIIPEGPIEIEPSRHLVEPVPIRRTKTTVQARYGPPYPRPSKVSSQASVPPSQAASSTSTMWDGIEFDPRTGDEFLEQSKKHWEDIMGKRNEKDIEKDVGVLKELVYKCPTCKTKTPITKLLEEESVREDKGKGRV